MMPGRMSSVVWKSKGEYWNWIQGGEEVESR